MFVAALSLAACGSPTRLPPPDDKPPPTFPVIDVFQATPEVVRPGETSVIRYTVRNADAVSIEGLLASTPTLSGEITTPPLAASHTYTLMARSSAGETMRRLVVTVADGEAQIVSFTSDPSIIAPGASSTLSWQTSSALQVVLSEQGGAVLDANAGPEGQRVVTPSANTTYVLTVDGDGGPKSREVTVLVGANPVIEQFSAAPPQITEGGSAMLSWRVSNADSILVRDQDNVVLVPSGQPTGSIMVTPDETRSYVLIASNDVGSAVQMVTVAVLPPGSARIVTFTATPDTLPGPGNVTIGWSTEDAETVDLLADGVSVVDFPRMPAGTHVVSLATTTRFELQAENAAGIATREITVTVGTPDVTAPVIQHTVIGADQAERVEVEVIATITDAESGVGSATMFYRAQGATPFVSVSMVNQGNDRYRAAIPANAVLPPAIQYYIQANDTAMTPNAATAPIGAPANLNSFTVRPNDQMPPTITHTPIAPDRPEDAAVMIAAQVTDASGVAAVRLFYKRPAEALFTSVAMTAAGNNYSASIPASAVLPPGMMYYIEASDTLVPANIAWSPATAPTTPHEFSVVAIDRTAPTITHTPISNGQPAGGAVTVNADVADDTGVGAVSLFYKHRSSGTYTSVVMTGAGATRVAQIPSSVVMDPAVDYYIEATDTAAPANTGRVPASAPATPYSFTVSPVDNAPPTISHTPPANGQLPNAPLVISASVVDGSGVGLVNLRYRRRGTTPFSQVTMTGGPTYSGTIPASVVQAPGVDYYIEAADASPNVNVAVLPSTAPAALFGFTTGVAEVEPNNTAAAATVVLLDGNNLSRIGLGAITPATDRDFWIVDVPAGAVRYTVRAELTAGGAGVCQGGADPRLTLYAANGTTVLVTDDLDGVGNCSLIDPITDSAARALAPGRYYLTVEEDGNNATIGAYELRASMGPVVCGNSILESAAGEQCDDGNMVSGDGCSSICRIEPIGTFNAPGGAMPGSISPAGDVDTFAIVIGAGQFLTAETSNGAGGCPGDTVIELYGPDGITLLGSDDEDGPGSCSLLSPVNDPFTANMAAGTYFLRVRAFNATTVISAYTLTVTIASNYCGNSTVETGEQCDDGNRTASDGCSATCQWELEGTAMGAGASFMGAITPAGNIDWYAIVVPNGYSIRAETFSPSDGLCTAGTDTVIRLWASNRTTQVATDDDDGVDRCSLLDPASDVAARGLAAGTYYVSVEEYGNNGTIAAYVLNISIVAPACGDGFVNGTEQCDDGNTTAGDGCSATCAFEGTGETEPNNTTATANTFLIAGNSSARILGTISASTDVDVYSVVVPAGASLTARVIGTNGGCPFETNLRLRNAAGTSIVYDTDDGPATCPRISPGGDTGARNLAAGTYFLEVTGVASQTIYALDVQVSAPGCGDLYLAAGEQCDDGNTAAGDGCSATCQFELMELEPNNTSSAAQSLASNIRMVGGAISPANDHDWYAVTVPQGASIGLFTHTGAQDQCGNLDTVVTVFNPAGMQLVEDDSDGPGYCSWIYPSELSNLAAGTYRIRVRAWSAGATFSYALSIE